MQGKSTVSGRTKQSEVKEH